MKSKKEAVKDFQSYFYSCYLKNRNMSTARVIRLTKALVILGLERDEILEVMEGMEIPLIHWEQVIVKVIDK